MISNDLINYVNEKLAQGRSYEQIRELLMTHGWSQTQIAEAFASSSTPVNLNPTLSPKASKHIESITSKSREEDDSKAKTIFIIVSVIILGLIVLGVAIFSSFDSSNHLKITNTSTSISLNLDQPLDLLIKGRAHNIELNSIGVDYAVITMHSKTKTANFSISESKDFDINFWFGDDVTVTLDSITNLVPSFSIKTIEKEKLLKKNKTTAKDYFESTYGDLKNSPSNYDDPSDVSGNTQEQKSSTPIVADFKKNDTDNTEYKLINEGFSVVDISRLKAAITSSKVAYAVGEKVDGRYTMSYDGNAFKAFILYSFSKSGYGNVHYNYMISTMSKENPFVLSKDLEAFSLDKTSFTGGLGSFKETGSYTYSLAVYDCKDLDEEIGYDCGLRSSIDEKRIETVTPLKFVSKSFDVTEKPVDYGCTSDSECTTSCKFCESGTEICSYTDKSCKQCTSNFDCLSGYVCVGEKCVECADNFDCFDGDVSTKDVCSSDYTCSNPPILTCIDNDYFCPANCDETTDSDCAPVVCKDVVDCGVGAANDCFIQAATSCCPAKLDTTNNFEIFGTILHSKYQREIKGMQGDRCELYTYMEEYDLTLTQDEIDALIDEGYTQEEIDLEIQNLNELSYEGDSGTCKYPVSDLVEVLEDEQEGNFIVSTTASDEFECSGSLYEIKTN